jgi:hypothetical protein
MNQAGMAKAELQVNVLPNFGYIGGCLHGLGCGLIKLLRRHCQVTLADNIIALENRAGFMACKRHGHPLRNACSNEIPKSPGVFGTRAGTAASKSLDS